MLSKNNLQLLTQRGARQRQRFALRKLTVGVASVLLGTTFFIGAASADTTPAATTTAQPDSAAGTTSVTATPQQPAVQQTTTAVPASQQPATTSVNQAQPATADISGLQFTGSVNNFQNTTAGQQATDLTFKPGDTADLTYYFRSSGDGSQMKNGAWPVASRYLLTIPAALSSPRSQRGTTRAPALARLVRITSGST